MRDPASPHASPAPQEPGLLELTDEMRAGVRQLWEALAARFPARELKRVQGFLEILRGESPHLVRPDHLQRATVPNLFFPALASRPWHDPALLPWVAALERAWPRIRAEYLALDPEDLGDYENPYALASGDVTEAARPPGWQAFYLYSSFRPVERNLARCPATSEILRELPIAKEALFSILQPGARLPEHADEYNFVLTCHLGIDVPEDCGIRVGGITRTWQDGKCLVLDTSYLHEAWNESPRRRAVLLIDVWHPGLTKTEVEALRFLRPGLEAVLGATPRDSRADEA